jgi:hypothetical protein
VALEEFLPGGLASQVGLGIAAVLQEDEHTYARIIFAPYAKTSRSSDRCEIAYFTYCIIASDDHTVYPTIDLHSATEMRLMHFGVECRESEL